MTKPRRLLAALALSVATALAATSCTLFGTEAGPPEGVTTLAGWAEHELGPLPGVDRVEASQYSVSIGAAESSDGTAEDAADLLDADLYSIDLDVVVDPQITADEIAAVALATFAFSEAHAGEGTWAARVTIAGPETPDADTDSVASEPLRVDVYPAAGDSVGETARAALEATTIASVASVMVVGLPSIQVTDAADLGAALDAVERLAFWTQGGNVGTVDGRVRLADVPELITGAGLHAIIDAALAHPGAQFWLEAANVGPRYPELYIDGVTADEAASIAARFLDPAMASATASAYVLEFNIRVSGAEGAVDTYGTFGGVPAP